MKGMRKGLPLVRLVDDRSSTDQKTSCRDDMNNETNTERNAYALGKRLRYRRRMVGAAHVVTRRRRGHVRTLLLLLLMMRLMVMLPSDDEAGGHHFCCEIELQVSSNFV